ncbi:MAG TPA: DEAD/DEAH box helicase family protein, partial [Beutenbergiaceae bacterium]|nr:DEAD/DEAH box helicase family protein [Beutenbergiaceae bacterium]
SNQNVQMTTALAGSSTRFIPFDKGHDGHAGNPPSETGSATDYLWREVLAPDTLLRILQSYALREKDGRLIFPRYHQLRAVEKVTQDVLDKGAGQRYLIWHSAGSGKTKTIAWLAHRLGRLYHSAEDKAFDSVIVISDRTVLDDQLRDAVHLLGAARGYVVGVGEKRGEAKSPQLRAALRRGGHIITCTLQSFPEVLKLIEGDENLAGRKWCVIADEAHSSQTGKASQGLRKLLSEAYTGDEEDDEGGLSTDDLLLMRDEAVANTPNITFIACTATPKHRTLRMFGTQADDGRWEAFDTYMSVTV